VRWAIAVAALVVIAARDGEASNNCKELESWARTLVQHSQAASQAASDAALACFFSGPDDKRLDELARTTRSLIQDVLTAAPKDARCDSAKLAMDKYAGSVMRTMGQYIGFAFAACSTQARGELRKLAAAGKVSEEDVGQALGPMAEKYWGTILSD
jgi:hypothetical protein